MPCTIFLQWVDPLQFQCRSESSFLPYLIADPDPNQTFTSQKVGFEMKNKEYLLYFTVCVGNTVPVPVCDNFFVNFIKIACSWIWICIPYTDPDPGEPNQCGSGSETLITMQPLVQPSNSKYGTGIKRYRIKDANGCGVDHTSSPGHTRQKIHEELVRHSI